MAFAAVAIFATGFAPIVRRADPHPPRALPAVARRQRGAGG